MTIECCNKTNQVTLLTKAYPQPSSDSLVDLRYVHGKRTGGTRDPWGSPVVTHLLAILAIHAHDSPVVHEVVCSLCQVLTHAAVPHLPQEAPSGYGGEGRRHVHEKGSGDDSPLPVLLGLRYGYPNRVGCRLLGPSTVLARVEASGGLAVLANETHYCLHHLAKVVEQRDAPLGFGHAIVILAELRDYDTLGQLPIIQVDAWADAVLDKVCDAARIPVGEALGGKRADPIWDRALLAARVLGCAADPLHGNHHEGPVRWALLPLVSPVMRRWWKGGLGQHVDLVLVLGRGFLSVVDCRDCHGSLGRDVVVTA